MGMALDWELGRTFDSASGEVRWERFGDPAAEPVVLPHGTPFSSYVWRAVARALAARHQVYVWDMPGYGASAKFDGQDVSLAAQGRVFTELLAHWGLAEPRVVAHDFGGAVALRAHLLHGARYQRLALVDPVALAPWGSPFFRLVGAHAEVFEQLPPDLHRALVREYVGSASSPGLHPATLDRRVAPWLGADGQPAFYRQTAQADQRFTDELQPRYAPSPSPSWSAGARTTPGFPSPRPTSWHRASPPPSCTCSRAPATWSRRTPRPNSPRPSCTSSPDRHALTGDPAKEEALRRVGSHETVTDPAALQRLDPVPGLAELVGPPVWRWAPGARPAPPRRTRAPRPRGSWPCCAARRLATGAVHCRPSTVAAPFSDSGQRAIPPSAIGCAIERPDLIDVSEIVVRPTVRA